MQNITCAIAIVQNPSGVFRLRKRVRSDAPRTISGVDIGRKIRRLVAPPAEPVTHERERDHRADDGRADAGDRGDLERLLDRVPQTWNAVPVPPVLPCEALPRVVEASGRIVERERDHDRDRQQEIDEREQRVHRQQVVPDAVEDACASDGTCGRVRRHPVSLSVPSARAYAKTPTRIAAISTNASDAAAG
jgi:hypothetical protein